MNSAQSQDKPLVSGEISFAETSKPVSKATVYVRLEDVSRLDAASRLISEAVLHDVSLPGGDKDRLKFDLYGEVPDAKADYNVRVHVDVDGDGQVSRGDYITMESYPVLTWGQPSYVAVRVREVK